MTSAWDAAPHARATDREGPGSFREHEIAPFPGGTQPPPWTDVPALMRDWITDAQALRGADEATIAESLAALHARFEQIHPFLDGNGRAGRLVLNPASDHLQQQQPLAIPRRAPPSRPRRFIVPAVAGPARLVPLPALATDELSANALRVAAIRGRLKAAKAADGSWRSSPA